MQKSDLIIRDFHIADYEFVWQKMQLFTNQRTEKTVDEMWLLEHFPVFTQGLAGKPEHILNLHDIPIIQTDRGGQVTYHGPGQLIVYPLLNLKRKKWHARELVTKLENTIIDLLQQFQIKSKAHSNAPGVYIDDEKICSIGLRIRRDSSYHGIALNVDMDLTPFSYINPCGFKNLKMTQIKTFVPSILMLEIKSKIVPIILKNFGYQNPKYKPISLQDAN